MMLKTRYSFKPDIAHGGSFACGVAVPFGNLERDSQASEGACVVYRSLSVRVLHVFWQIRSDFVL